MEKIQITKKDDNTIEVVKEIPVAFTFTPEYLKQQREVIVAQKEREMAQRDAEIAEIDGYLAEMNKLGVCEKNKEETIIEQSKKEVVLEEQPIKKDGNKI